MPESYKDIADSLHLLSDWTVDDLCKESMYVHDICEEGSGIIKEMMEKLAAYEDAEEQGLLVRLPCKVGDTLFFAQVCREEPFSMRVQGISISASGNDVILHFGGFPITNAWGNEVGKTLYLTREEAEAAMKGETKDGT